MSSTSDRLALLGLEVRCVIGDLPEERGREQSLVMDVSLACDLSLAGAHDVLEETVDYAALAEAIRVDLQQARCRMIEHAAERVARVCLAQARVTEVTVHLEKAGAVSGLRAAAVTITRQQQDGSAS